MSVEDYSDFLRSMGHRVLITDSSRWYNVSPGFYMNFPFHYPIYPQPSEIRTVIGSTGIAVRYTCPDELGHPSYQTICRDKNYDLEALPQKGRNRTRRGLESCSVRQLEFKELEALGGLELDRDTLIRQGRRIPRNHDNYWLKYYSSAARSKSMETWGSFVDDELAAYLIAWRVEDCVNVLWLRSRSKHLNANPNNALLYVFTQETISRKEINQISLGLESPQSDLPELLRFKLRMGYQKMSIGQRIEFNHLFRPILRRAVLDAVRKTAVRVLSGEHVNRFAGVLRWYEEQPDPSHSR